MKIEWQGSGWWAIITMWKNGLARRIIVGYRVISVCDYKYSVYIEKSGVSK